MMAGQTDALEEVADLCITACEAALRIGTPDIQIAARLLLEALGRELARRADPRSAHGDGRSD